jgi:hypothetical protein
VHDTPTEKLIVFASTMSSNLSRSKVSLQNVARKGQLADALLINFCYQFHAVDAQIRIRSDALRVAHPAQKTPQIISRFKKRLTQAN